MLQELLRRATSGQTLNRHVLFYPSLVYPILRDPFWVWCEYHAPQSEAVDETGRLSIVFAVDAVTRWRWGGR